MITNAERHKRTDDKGVWRTAHTVKPCSHYFGSLSACLRLIAVGARYFDTQESADGNPRASFVVCANCANAVQAADFLKEST